MVAFSNPIDVALQREEKFAKPKADVGSIMSVLAEHALDCEYFLSARLNRCHVELDFGLSRVNLRLEV